MIKLEDDFINWTNTINDIFNHPINFAFSCLFFFMVGGFLKHNNDDNNTPLISDLIYICSWILTLLCRAVPCYAVSCRDTFLRAVILQIMDVQELHNILSDVVYTNESHITRNPFTRFCYPFAQTR